MKIVALLIVLTAKVLAQTIDVSMGGIDTETETEIYFRSPDDIMTALRGSEIRVFCNNSLVQWRQCQFYWLGNEGK